MRTLEAEFAARKPEMQRAYEKSLAEREEQILQSLKHIPESSREAVRLGLRLGLQASFGDGMEASFRIYHESLNAVIEAATGIMDRSDMPEPEFHEANFDDIVDGDDDDEEDDETPIRGPLHLVSVEVDCLA